MSDQQMWENSCGTDTLNTKLISKCKITTNIGYNQTFIIQSSQLLIQHCTSDPTTPIPLCISLTFSNRFSKYELFRNRVKLAVGYVLCIGSCSGIIISNVTHCTFTWLYMVFNYWAGNRVYSKTSYFHVLRIYCIFPRVKLELLQQV